MRAALLCHLFLAAAVAVAQPPIPPAADHARPAAVRTGDSLTVADGKFADVAVEVPAGASVVWRFYPPPLQRADKLPPGRAIFAGERGKSYVVTAIVVDFKKQSVTDTEFTVLFEGKAGPKPDDPLPPPKPKPDPKPEPVTSFHVLFVIETGKTYPAAVTSVLYGKTTDDYLTGVCTGGKAGWGTRDKDFPPDQDRTPLRAMWEAVKAKNPAPPCVAIAVNGEVSIDVIKGSPAEQVAAFKAARGEK